MVRVGGIVLACVIGLPIAPAIAQGGYPYPPARGASGPYADEAPPPGYYERALRRYDRRIQADMDDEDVVVIDRRGRRVYFDDGYPVAPYPRRYGYVVPGPYDDAPPPRPFFRERDDRQTGPDERRWRDRQAALPPAPDPGARMRPGEPPGPAQEPIPRAGQSGGTGLSADLPPRLRRQVVEYRTKEPAGAIIVDTRNTYLYYVLGGGQAVRYGIGVGREGFTWAGTEKVSRMAEWPDWYPPKDMIERQPYLPRMMAGGPGNPLGARALYLGNTLYRIHGTNEPQTIGKYVSSGCIRLLNEDIADLYSRVKVGTRVVVLRGGKSPATASIDR